MNTGMIPIMWTAWSTNLPRVLVSSSVRGRRA